jgi:hypothetical protein
MAVLLRVRAPPGGALVHVAGAVTSVPKEDPYSIEHTFVCQLGS